MRQYFLLPAFSITLFLLVNISYAHCYNSSVSPMSGDTSTTFKFCGSTNAIPSLYIDGMSKGSMSTASAGECPDNTKTEYKFTLTGSGLTVGNHDYKVYTSHGDCTGTFEIKSSTTTATTTVTDEGPYTAGSTQYSWSRSGYSLWQSILKVKEDQTLKGVEQYITDISTGKKYWAVVIDAGTSKPSSYTGTGTVLVAKELGTTSSSTTGWVGAKDGLDVKLKKDHWYIIGIAIDSSGTRKWYYKSSSTSVDFGWAEFHPGSYWDTGNPPDSTFGGCSSCNFLLYTRFYLQITPVATDTTPPTVTVTGSPSSWTNSGTASVSCTDSSGCGSATYRLKTYATNPSSCSTKYSDYTLTVPYTVDSNVWICGAAKDTAGNVGFSSPVEFKIDKTTPTVSLNVYQSVETYWVAKVECSDSLSGCKLNTYATYKSNTEITTCPTDYSKYVLGSFTYIGGSNVWICGSAKDYVGNIGYTPSPIKVDKIPPVRSDGKPSGTVTSSDATLSLKTDEYSTCRYSTTAGTEYDSMKKFPTTDGTTHSETLSKLSDGNKNYYVKCVDAAENKNTDDYTIAFAVDTTPPSTSITSIAGDISAPYWDISNDGKTSIVISGEKGMSCRWETNDVQYSSMNEDNECSVLDSGATCSLPDLSQGDYTRYVSCKDSAENEQVVDSSKTTGNEDVSFGIDWTKPTVSIDSPASGWLKDDFTMQYDATDTNIEKCGVSTKDGSGSFIERMTACGNDKTLKVTVGNNKFCPTEGKDACSVKVYAKDKATNENEIIGSFSIDLSPPIISSLTHLPQESITGDTDVTIKAEASDSLSGLSEIKIFVDDFTNPKKTCTSSPCLYTSKYTGGVHKYTAKVLDKVGNEQISLMQQFTVTAPVSVNLKVGWNLLSVPYKEFGFSSTTCDLRNFYNYDTATKTWNIVKHTKDLQGGKGYWFYSEKACAIEIIATEEYGIQQNDLKLVTGWNQIGSTIADVTFASIKGGCSLQSILEYDTVVSNWKVLKETDKIESYKAYFIKAAC